MTREVVAALPGLDLSRPIGQEIRQALAIARRDTAADALEWFGLGLPGWPINAAAALTLAAEVRSGSRTIVTTGEED